ncbi:synaptogyrin isoform X2 [Folsomia candida]|uniref:synaptogyrin isoform X2 n=1 Tax=Folsomia candida TaxID=158441 RepID=UPI000B90373E|nr:synaptogyrin isoform X2 [Folsomia candida]
MMMDGGGAFGGAKAGAAFDPVTFAKKPPVILRGLCLLFAIIVFGCISSEGWRYDRTKRRETCLFNDDGNACNFGVGIGVIAFLAAIGFLAGEYLFEQMSSVKTRKHYVLGDLAFSGLWAFLYFVAFCYLSNEWSKSDDPPGGVGVGNVKAAIAFSFFSIFSWAGCGFFAYTRFRQGAEQAFAPAYEVDSGAMPGATAYSSYPGGQDMGPGGYSEPPFNTGRGGGMEYATPTY